MTTGDNHTPTTIERVTKMAEYMVEQQQRVAIAEEDLRNAKAALLRVQREDLPELMRELGLLEFKLKTGERIELLEDVQCGITQERRGAAMQWLNQHGFGGLIKTVVSVEFGRGDIVAAEELALRLQADGLPATADETVHPSTLKSFIKEQLEKGASVPFDLFGVLPFAYAKFTQNRSKK